MSVTTPKIVQPGNSRVYVWLLLFVVVLSALFFAYREVPFWMKLESGGSAKLEAELTQKADYISQLEAERDALRLSVAALERTSQIDREAVNQVREEMKQFHAKRLEIEEELTFLRGLVSNGITKEGLYIQGFKLESGVAEREYRFRFTVSQRLKNIGTAIGWINLVVEGKNKDDTQSLTLEQVTADSADKTDKIKMRFKHFQNVDGVITLPEGFQPHSVIVEIEPDNSDLSPVKKRFDWLLAG
jgi:hypothetical protein